MKDPLELANRKRIFEAVRQNPGVHFRGLQRLVDMRAGVLSYHLVYLVDKGLLTMNKERDFTRYFPGGRLDREKQRMLSALRQEIPRGIILFLLANPGATHGQVLEGFTISGGTLSYHVKKLVAKGLVRVERTGRESHLTVIEPDKISDLLVVYRRSFLDKLVDEFIARYVGTEGPPAEARPDIESLAPTDAFDSSGSSRERQRTQGPGPRP